MCLSQGYTQDLLPWCRFLFEDFRLQLILMTWMCFFVGYKDGYSSDFSVVCNLIFTRTGLPLRCKQMFRPTKKLLSSMTCFVKPSLITFSVISRCGARRNSTGINIFWLISRFFSIHFPTVMCQTFLHGGLLNVRARVPNKLLLFVAGISYGFRDSHTHRGRKQGWSACY